MCVDFSTLMLLLIPGLLSQPQVRGSIEASQLAVNSFQFILAAPKNCLETLADLPRGASKNMAALWIRAAFHDAGSWHPSAALPGGADASLLSFLNEPENSGLEESVAPKFMQNPRVNMSRADMIALAGQVSVSHCGGPRFQFRPGRVDATVPVSPTGRIPDGAMRLAQAKPMFDRMGWTNEDIVVLVTGSHTMGYFFIHIAVFISPILPQSPTKHLFPLTIPLVFSTTTSSNSHYRTNVPSRLIVILPMILYYDRW
jgi:hypothetical protein